jgi:hypothetical protein
VSLYEEEPGIHFDASTQRLNICWTVRGDEDFRMVMDDLCMSLNDLSAAGTQIEVTFYDTEFDDEDEASGSESRDDFVMLFVGPDPGAIMQAQRDLLVHDVVNMMERHFDGAELSGVVRSTSCSASALTAWSAPWSLANRRVARGGQADMAAVVVDAAQGICTDWRAP